MKTDTEYLHEALEVWRALPSSRGLQNSPFYELPLSAQSGILSEAQAYKQQDMNREAQANGIRYERVIDNA